MGNTRILIFTVVFVFAVTSVVLFQSSKVDMSQEVLDPPRIILRSESKRIAGILGSYCRDDVSGKEVCVKKFPPTQITTRATLISKDVSSNSTLYFEVVDDSFPERINFNIGVPGGEVLRRETYTNQGFSMEKEGEFLIVADAYWDNRSVTYTYQVETK